MGGLRCFGAILILSCAACNPSNDEALGRLSKLTAATNQLEIMLHITERIDYFLCGVPTTEKLHCQENTIKLCKCLCLPY